MSARGQSIEQENLMLFSMLRSRRRMSVRYVSGLALALGVALLQPLSVSSAAEAVPIGEGRTMFFVSPNGNDAGPGTEDNPFRTLVRARDAVRGVNDEMRKDIVVNLKGGTYSLSQPLRLTAADSGSNGYDVVYRAVPGEMPVISGGKRLTGWSLYDKETDIYVADVGDLRTRQLYVNGERATRARGPMNPQGFTETATGYASSDETMASWRNPSDIEVVDRVLWKEFRCPVASVEGSAITMQQPCWDNANLHRGIDIGTPTWIENAFELLDTPGEWYLDEKAGQLYYMPRTGEELSTADVVAPALESLVRGEGTLDAPLRNVHFEGLNFAYSTWLAPISDEGYAIAQSGFRIVGSNNPDFNSTRPNWAKTPAAVTFKNARGVALTRNTFSQIGSVGVNVESGSQDNTITGNLFQDISASGIQIGGVEEVDHHPDDPRQIVKDNTVDNNVITRIGAEYSDGVGVWVGYTDHTTVAHNDLFDLPYSGIVVGWGWGLFDAGGNPSYPGNAGVPIYDTPTTSQNNVIAKNRIVDLMQVLFDGGAIYTLGASPGTVVTGNYIRCQRNEFGALYPDEGSADVSFTDNVVENTVRWLHVWTPSIHDLLIADNYHDNQTMTVNGTNITMRNNPYVQEPQALPASIISGAGLQPAYKDLNPAPPPSDSSAPSAPEELQGLAVQPTVVGLTWNAASDDVGVTGYEIYQDTELIGVSANPKFQVSGLTPEVSYHFSVRARDAAVNLSAASSTVAIQMPPSDTRPPATPQRPTAEILSPTIVDLTWPATTDDWGVTGYRVYRDGQLVAEPREPSARVSGLSPGESYEFTVRAQDAAGNLSEASPPSATVVMPESDNLALGKAARALFVDGSTAVMQPGSLPGDAVDGDLSTVAQASDQYRWQLEVDLGSVNDIGTVVTDMPSRAYASEFEIRTSTDGETFTTVRSVSGFAGGTSTEQFSSLAARYIRVMAIKPDGPGQAGSQMSIAELEIYPPR